jgi:starvation-inducible DNA-binding protein
MHTTHNTLPEAIREQSAEILNQHLAAAIDLQGQLKQAHWNVRGPGFFAVHELFDKAAGEVGGYADLLAERASGLGSDAMGTIQTAVAVSFLVPYPLRVASVHEHVFAAAAAIAAFDQSVVGAIGRTAASGDAVTSDLLTEIARGTAQLLWLIEAHNLPAK